jgi:hypothetical protein
MKRITLNQLKKLHTIVSKQKIDEETKRMMISGFSGGRTLSSKELSFTEAAAIIQHIEKHDPQYLSLQKMRGKILYYAHEMGWRKQGSGGKPVADGKAVDEWMLKYSYRHKKLDAYLYEELPILVTQFEAVYRTYIKSI